MASCPQQSDLNFGINTVPGLTDELVAVSSDGTLPDPRTDSDSRFEDVIAAVRLHKHFLPRRKLTLAELSQLLWAGYGCTPHWTANSRGGLTVSSWMADYFLTDKIYVVQDQVQRYCNRAGSALRTRNHRLELVHDADVRAAVHQALPGLAEAPCYVLLCLTETGLNTWYQRLETGFAAGGMLAQAAALGLGCDFQVALTRDTQTQLQQVTRIPATHYPHAVVAIGQPRWSPTGRVEPLDARIP